LELLPAFTTIIIFASFGNGADAENTNQSRGPTGAAATVMLSSTAVSSSGSGPAASTGAGSGTSAGAAASNAASPGTGSKASNTASGTGTGSPTTSTNASEGPRTGSSKAALWLTVATSVYFLNAR
jgi:hypothetical protein